MKIKTSKLTGRALSYAVAISEGWAWTNFGTVDTAGFRHRYERTDSKGTQRREVAFMAYADNWELSGPLIERHRLNVGPYVATDEGFRAYRWTETGGTDMKSWSNGPTPLIAAMRCIVASKLGDEVDVPDELVA